MAREIQIPSNHDTEKSEYAGKDPVYENRQVVRTRTGEKVVIMNYLKDKGLYVVMNIDKPGVTSPAYKIHPDKLVKIEEDEKEPMTNLSNPDLVVGADTFAEYRQRAEELTAQGYKFDRNIPKSDQDSHIAAYHRDQQIDKVAVSPAFANPDIAQGETDGELLPDYVGIWYTMNE